MSFLGLEGKKILIFGMANRKSVAFHIAEVLKESGAELVFSVLGKEQSDLVNKFFPDSAIHICDVSDERQLQTLAAEIGGQGKNLWNRPFNRIRKLYRRVQAVPSDQKGRFSQDNGMFPVSRSSR